LKQNKLQLKFRYLKFVPFIVVEFIFVKNMDLN
jgi:hypothetical protein